MSGCNGWYLEEEGLITDAPARLTVAAVKCGGLGDEEFERYILPTELEDPDSV